MLKVFASFIEEQEFLDIIVGIRLYVLPNQQTLGAQNRDKRQHEELAQINQNPSDLQKARSCRRLESHAAGIALCYPSTQIFCSTDGMLRFQTQSVDTAQLAVSTSVSLLIVINHLQGRCMHRPILNAKKVDAQNFWYEDNPIE